MFKKLYRYGPDEIEHRRFDATLSQALAWKRLEARIYNLSKYIQKLIIS